MAVALKTAIEAVTVLGGSVGDVVRTRIYLLNRSDCESVGAVHGECFAQARPVATMVLVAGLIEEEMLVEVEVEARVGTADQAKVRGPST
jgi:enamine deaminase RidA (YjgF/YER057c/UK114 family)